MFNQQDKISPAEIISDITLTTNELGLNSPFVVEKDLYVLKAIQALTQVQHETFELIFQGGTALVKAHHFVKRMSEDCDFRMAYQRPGEELKKDAQRKILREFRQSLLTALREHDFKIDPEDIRVRNQGQFMAVRAHYPAVFDTPTHLKPYLALDFFLAQVKTPTVQHPITSLMRETLGDKVQHPYIDVTCMSLDETAAEKWVALTRRIATAQERSYYYSHNLVRHMYDLMMIERHHPLGDAFSKLVTQVMAADRAHFEHHSDFYASQPIQASKTALSELQHNPLWKENWERFMNIMVYGDKPPFEEAIAHLNHISQKALKFLESET